MSIKLNTAATNEGIYQLMMLNKDAIDELIREAMLEQANARIVEIIDSEELPAPTKPSLDALFGSDLRVATADYLQDVLTDLMTEVMSRVKVIDHTANILQITYASDGSIDDVLVGLSGGRQIPESVEEQA